MFYYGQKLAVLHTHQQKEDNEKLKQNAERY